MASPLIPAVGEEPEALQKWWEIHSQYSIPSKPYTFRFSVPVHVETAYVSTEGMLPAINALRAEVAGVKDSLARQQELMEQILAVLQGSVAEVEIEDVSNDQARARIVELFNNPGVSLFYDEIAEKLKLPLRQTVDICNQLESEGLIGERTK